MLFKISNTDLVKNAKKTYLTAAVVATGTTLTVKDNAGAVNAGYFFIGEIGEEGTELTSISGAVTYGTSITCTALTFAHGVDTPVYFVNYNQVEFSRATTLTGSKSVLTTISIDPSEFYSYYNDTSNSTGFGFVRWKNQTTVIYSNYSGGVNYEYDEDYSSYDRKTLFRMAERVRKHISENPDNTQVTDDEIRDALNTKQEEVFQKRHWSFAEAERSQALVANQFAYDISSHLDGDRIQYVICDTQPMIVIDNYKWKMFHFDSDASSTNPSHCKIWNRQVYLYPRPSSASSSTTLGAAITTTTATSITVASSASFNRGDFFRLKIDDEIIYATASTSTTFTGCLRGREGTTAATHLIAATVTELDLVVSGQLKPVDLFLSSDRTSIPRPEVIETGAAMDIAYGNLKDNQLGDRMKVLYSEKLKALESDYSMKDYGSFARVKVAGERMRDTSYALNQNNFPKSVN